MRRFIAAAAVATMAFGNIAFTEAPEDAVIVDITGDANGFNDQTDGSLFDNNAGPGSASWADLTHMRVIPGNVTTEIRLGVANLNPDTSVIFRMMTDFSGCSTWFQVLNYETLAGSVRFTSDCGDIVTGTYSDGITVELDEETSEYVMLVKFGSLPKEVAGLLKRGATASGIELSSRTFAGAGSTGATVPQMDHAKDEIATFKI